VRDATVVRVVAHDAGLRHATRAKPVRTGKMVRMQRFGCVLLRGSTASAARRHPRPDLRTPQRRNGAGRLSPFGQRRQQPGGRRGNLGDSPVERLPGRVGQGLDSGDFTDVLPGGRLDLLGGRCRFESAQLCDVPAHIPKGSPEPPFRQRLARYGRVPAAHPRTVASVTRARCPPRPATGADTEDVRSRDAR